MLDHGLESIMLGKFISFIVVFDVSVSFDFLDSDEVGGLCDVK